MPTRLTINLAALAANYHVLTAEAAGAEVAPVVKADGYGLGAAEVSGRLWDEGARTFFVARLSEGVALRQAMTGRPCEIVVLDGLTPGSGGAMQDHNLTPAIIAPEQAARWRGRSFLHVNTGMNRLGVSLTDASELARTGYRPAVLMSHLGNADDPHDARNAAQLAQFREARALFPDARASLAASSGIYLGADYRFDLVRPGISLYGGGPREIPDPRFKAVATLESTILQINDLKPGDQAGYGAMFTAPWDMRLAIVDCGYADGILRRGHRGGYGWVRGKRAPVAIVTMDLIGLDVTEIDGAAVGDAVELLGENAKLDHLAKAAGSVAHECLVRLGGRAERRHIHQNRNLVR